MDGRRLPGLLERFRDLRVVVFGDFFLDTYLEIDTALDEPSLETGKTARQVVDVRHSPGAAGTVTANLAALGAGSIHAAGFTGDDGNGLELVRGLEAIGCGTDHLVRTADRLTPVYMKPRDRGIAGLAGEFERLDIVNRAPTPHALQETLTDRLESLLTSTDAVIIVDQVSLDGTGAVTAAMRDTLSAMARAHDSVVFLAESRRNILRFRDVIVKPNQFEALGMDTPPPGHEPTISDLEQALPDIRARIGAPVAVTLGAHGILVSDPVPEVVPAVRACGPLDTTGAGDSVAAAMTLALAAGASLPEAACIGNLAAGVTVRKLDECGTCTPEEMVGCWREAFSDPSP